MTLITVRIIKSFEYQTTKLLILRLPDEVETVSQLMQLAKHTISSSAEWRVYHSVVASLDTMKMHHVPHQAKSQNLMINEENPEFDAGRTLQECGINGDDYEVTLYSRAMHDEFKRQGGKSRHFQ